MACDTHSHTVASTHAYSTLHDYIASAKDVGLSLLSITDHGPEMPDSPHMWHFGNMKVWPRLVDNIGILRGIEANILSQPFQGSGHRYVDLPDGMLPFLDFAIASFHEPVFTPGSIKDNTAAMIRAIKSGVVQIIGHPGNPNYPINQDEVVRAAKDNNVLLEINNSSFLLSRKGSEPICKRLLETVANHDWKISVSSDAHISYDVGKFDQAEAIIEKVGFNPDNIVTKTPKRFLSFLQDHGKSFDAELLEWANKLES
ncbi:phosphatase [Reinekea marina]|uniref:phosphatase n=1 Tax=Reinekea marina TaxID=1310421 RepID=UPI0025B34630|nr:phosphatase [Reinekea marina]MDN3649131.1 phosphatase [Reinekea marina]